MKKNIEIISSLSNPKIKFISGLFLRKNRISSGLFLVEGERVVKQAIISGWVPKYLIYLTGRQRNPEINKLINKCIELNGTILEVSNKILSKISRKDNPQMILAVFEQKYTSLEDALKIKNTWVGLDRVRDPGNLGTIIRTCDAVGAEGVILIDSCCDPFSPEATRASMGAIFSLKVVKTESDEFIKSNKSYKGKIIGTSMKASDSYLDAKWGKNPILLMGNEQSGLSKKLEERTDQNIKLPMKGSSDSLNLSVATGILLFEIVKHKI